MGASITWLDHDRQARERSLRILALFRERESRDELGIGAIRDSLADQLFPGTSTLQTRLAYMLLIPWVYQYLEGEKTPSSRIAAEARKLEIGLIAPLLADGDQRGQEIYGVIGRVAGSDLKRLPSSIYWAGLGTWCIRRFHGSQDDYHRSLDELYVRRAARRRRDDDEWEDEELYSWHPKLPAPPSGFPSRASFDLRADDRSFLRDRLLTACSDSYLAWLTRRAAEIDGDYPWTIPGLTDVPAAIKALLDEARLFSEVIHGAVILYNLQLSELAERAALVDQYQKLLDEWATAAPWGEIGQWNLSRFWSVVQRPGYSITHKTQTFVAHWTSLAIEQRGRVAGTDEARQLVRTRELDLKKGRSRFTNRASLGQWGGASGTGRLDFRWPNVQTFVRDLAGTD